MTQPNGLKPRAESYRPFGAGRLGVWFPGLKPRAESYRPFGAGRLGRVVPWVETQG